MKRELLQLGDPRLYQRSAEILPSELVGLRALVEDLHDTLMAFRRVHGWGKAIAAPQIGVAKRMIYVHIDSPIIIVNPVIHFPDEEMTEVLDSCLAFPEMVVKVRRYHQCALRYRNLDFLLREVILQEDLATLLQHKVDHLDGVLATMRAVDEKAFYSTACARQLEQEEEPPELLEG